jgi:plasmid replication initiation protein
MSRLIVRQSNDLIEASYKIASLGESRLVRLLISQISPQDEDFKTYQISVTDFAQVFDLNPRDGRIYELLYEASQALVSRQIRIRRGKSWLITNWLSSAEYRDGTGFVELRFDGKLKPYLLQLKEYYTEYGIEQTVHFKSLYSVRLFELLKKEAFKANSKGQFKVALDYQHLRELMGIENNEYDFFKDFRVRVIETAQREINRFSSLNIVQIDYAKTGRKVSHLVFHVEHQQQRPLELVGGSPEVTEKPEHPQDVLDLIEAGINAETATKWRKKYGAERIKRNYFYAKGLEKSGKIKESLAGFIAKAITEDIAEAWERKEKEKQEKNLAQQEAEFSKLSHEEQKRLRSEETTVRAFDDFYKLPEAEQMEIKRLYLTHEKNETRLRDWSKAEKAGKIPEYAPLVKLHFRDFFITYQANLRLPVDE